MSLRYPTFGACCRCFFRRPSFHTSIRTPRVQIEAAKSRGVHCVQQYRRFHSTERTQTSPGLSNMPKRKAEKALNGSNGHSNDNGTKEAVNGSDMKGLGGTTDLPPVDATQKKQSAWSGPGQAAFDFRSMHTHHFTTSRKSLII
jgi:hypothetical protein